MSGICGLFHLDGQPAEGAGIDAMTSLLRRHGPDRAGRWLGGSVGLGHTLLASTPGSMTEAQPFVHHASGCAITADVRLDNRHHLLASLAPDRDPTEVGDAELVLLAYLRWGTDCADHLLGDFAFAIRDPRENALFCARDHSGMRLLYYHHEPRRRFAFATDPRAILVLPQVPFAIDEGRIADFLVQELEWIDYTSSFFEGIYRLPPGHRLRVTPERLEITEYWRPAPGPSPGHLSDDEWREGFLEVLSQAVDARLRAPDDGVGSMLSGGMDSGTVVAIASTLMEKRGRGPLPTYSATANLPGDHREFTEVRAISAATSLAGLSPTLVRLEDRAVDVGSLMAGDGEPFDGECVLLKALYRAAAADGRRVILDGAGGDVVLADGTYIVRLIRGGRWRQARREIDGQCHYWEMPSSGNLVVRYWRSALVPQFVKRLRRRGTASEAERLVEQSLMSWSFAERVRLGERVGRNRLMFPGTRVRRYADERCQGIRPNMTGGRERYARLAASAGIDACDPYMDKRVIDYCAYLPGHLRLRDGWPKIILRDLMRDRLPEDVLWARGKPHIGWLFNSAATARAAADGTLTLQALRSSLDPYVDDAKLSRAWNAFQGGGNAEPVHTAFVLACWLRDNATRPVVTD